MSNAQCGILISLGSWHSAFGIQHLSLTAASSTTVQAAKLPYGPAAQRNTMRGGSP
jgi:hypothetical protein